jgi:dynein heavy chain 1
VTIQGEWAQWNNKVPKIEVETHKVGSPDIVVPTLDTVRHESLLYTWLAEHKPMVLCGPPGSGKTMTLFSALRALPDFEVCKACTYVHVHTPAPHDYSNIYSVY